MHISKVALAVERLSDEIDCDDLEQADLGSLERLRDTCAAMLAAIEAERGYRQEHRAQFTLSTPLAWTTPAFAIEHRS